jgi:hypothetical protein
MCLPECLPCLLSNTALDRSGGDGSGLDGSGGDGSVGDGSVAKKDAADPPFNWFTNLNDLHFTLKKALSRKS